MPTANKPHPKKQRQPTEIYEQLCSLNRYCTAAMDLLTIFSHDGIVHRNEGTYYRAMLEEIRASISQSIVEHMDGYEILAAAKADRIRLKIERKLLRKDE